MSFVGVNQAEFVAWTCFGVGIVLLGVGAFVGLRLSLARAAQRVKDPQSKLEEAKANLDDARQHIERTRSVVASSTLEGGSPRGPDVTQAVDAAKVSADQASSALEQVQGILAALPENLRFAGLLILVGTVLMSVATVQFGGISLF